MSEPSAAAADPPAPRFLPRAAVLPVALAFPAAFLALIAVPRIHGNPTLWITFTVIGVGLAGWMLLQARASERPVEIVWRPRAPHYVQMVAQSAIYTYWALHWDAVAAQVPLIVAQVLFGYMMDIGLSWRRYKRYRLGFGPWPITFSTNFFLWFRDDLFYLQFAMMALAYLSRELLQWKREGQSSHIFNPSGFGLSVASIVLIAGGWSDYTWGNEVSIALGNPPHCYEVVFFAGVIVQLFFPVVLVTSTAVITCVLAGLVYTAATGDFMFVDTAIPIAPFLGMTLLVTDPVSSPRSNVGRVLFGVLYGLSIFVLYDVLKDASQGGPNLTFFDKLLFLPVLNLLARPIDALTKDLSFQLGARRLGQRKANLIHVAVWVVAFFAVRPRLVDHPGRQPSHWQPLCAAGDAVACDNLAWMYRRACEGGVAEACHNLGAMAEAGEGRPPDAAMAAAAYERACRSGASRGCTALGVLFTQGRGVEQDDAKAAALYARACDEGDAHGCTLLGVATAQGLGRPMDVAAAAALFERACAAGDADGCRERAVLELATAPAAGRSALEPLCQGGDGVACDHLAVALLSGRGGPPDPARAVRLIRETCERGLPLACTHLAALEREGRHVPHDKAGAAARLAKACEAGHAVACADLATMHGLGDGVPKDEAKARGLLERACELGLPVACARLQAMR